MRCKGRCTGLAAASKLVRFRPKRYASMPDDGSRFSRFDPRTRASRARTVSAPVIREIAAADFDTIWPLFQSVIAGGDTYSYAPDTPFEEARALWAEPPNRTFVAEVDGRVVGAYRLAPNRSGLGDHVANGGYMVATEARGRGIASAMCEHSMDEARRAGFTALWILVFGLWVVSVYPDFSLFRANLNFLSWSLLAAPLYTMVSLGFRRPPSAGWRRWLRMAIPVTWAALGAIAIGFDDLSLQYFLRQPSPILLFWRAMSIAWAVAPPAVTVASILWIYDGTVEATSI